MHNFNKFVIYIMLFICNASVADVIVRMEIQQGAVIDNVDLRLYDSVAPVTVANFLTYVNDGDYSQSFIHRSVPDPSPGFVVQGGGFIFDPSINDGTFTYIASTGDYPGGLQPVPVDPPIVNEFNLSNLRGTIAMAKQAGDEDSATSQWFINLNNNSAILDVDNGGYTVFGDVLDNGMAVIDTIASQPVYPRTDIHPAFGELPLIDYISDPIENGNLVKVNKITELITITPDIDYGTVTAGSNVQPEVTIKNSGNDAIQLGGIGDINPVDDPFNIVDGKCANSIIQPGDQCSFMVLFSPEAEGTYMDSFNIEIVNYGISYEVTLRGDGGPPVDEADILVSFSSIDYGVVDVLDSASALPYTLGQIVQNTGNIDLTISSIELTGQDAAELNLSGNCLDVAVLAPGNFCSLSVEFKPLTAGEKTAEISFNTNDPDENPFIIPVRGTAAGEDDGVPAEIEDAGPNNGDGNNDDVLDSRQSNVATFVDSYGNYVTYLTDNSYRFSGMTSLNEADMAEMPADVDIGSGIFNFAVQNVEPGQSVEIGIILPPNLVPSAYYMYGPTTEDTDPHWYRFDFDGESGAVILNNVTFTTSDGRAFARNVLKVFHKDGGSGDADMTANGVIVVTSGMPVTLASDDGSGSASFILLLSIVVLLMISRGLSRRQEVRGSFH